MKHFLFIIMALTFAISAEAADVGVSISVGEPGFYGRVDIGDAPRPQLVYPEPVVIVPGPRGVEPLYMHVPPGHAKHWKKYCHQYNACNRPVYFVHDQWYNNVYVPHYQERHGHGGGHGKGHDDRDNRGHGKDHDEKDNRGHDRGHDRD